LTERRASSSSVLLRNGWSSARVGRAARRRAAKRVCRRRGRPTCSSPGTQRTTLGSLPTATSSMQSAHGSYVIKQIVIGNPVGNAQVVLDASDEVALEATDRFSVALPVVALFGEVNRGSRVAGETVDAGDLTDQLRRDPERSCRARSAPGRWPSISEETPLILGVTPAYAVLQVPAVVSGGLERRGEVVGAGLDGLGNRHDKASVPIQDLTRDEVSTLIEFASTPTRMPSAGAA
jgi:hypothetical protein